MPGMRDDGHSTAQEPTGLKPAGPVPAGVRHGRGAGPRGRALALAAGVLLLGMVALPGSSAAEPLAVHTTAATLAAPAAAPTATPACDPETSLPPNSSDSGPDVERIIKRGKLIAGIDTNSYLWGFRNPVTGDLQGFDIDLVHALAQSILGNPNAVEFLAVPTANRITALQSGEVDVVVRTMTITCDRLQQVAFSTPYFVAGQEMVTPKSSPVTGLNSTVDGRKVCVATGSTGADLLNADKHGAIVVPVVNQLDCLVQMQLGDVDATITDNALGAGLVAQDPTMHLVGGTLDREVYGVAMKHGSDDLVRRVNAVLQNFLANQWNTEYDTWLKPLGASPGAPTPHFSG